MRFVIGSVLLGVGARLFGAGCWAAAAAAAMSPFLLSATGVGYEQHAYVWKGFGLWTRLWASWTLPLAWGFGWRAIREGRHYFAAIAVTARTIAFHFETGYLALAPMLLWPLVAGRPVVRSARRAAVLIGGSRPRGRDERTTEDSVTIRSCPRSAGWRSSDS